VFRPPVLHPELGPRLVEAVKDLDSKRVAALLAAGAPPDTRDADQWTPLMTLADNDGSLSVDDSGAPDVQSTVARLLVRYGADVDAVNNHGWTALMYASHSGLYNMVDLLLRHGASVSIADAEGRTPLMTASLWRNNDIVALLLRNCADPNAKDRHGHTALYYAAYFGEKDGPAREETSGATVTLLMAHGAR
jgi:ankyrin repeat protein